MAKHVKKGDTVVVITGDDKDKHGKVLSVNPEKHQVVVEGVNMVYRHVRPSRQNPQGGRLHVERPIHISNVLPLDSTTGKGSRVRYVVEDGIKKRVSTAGNHID